MQPKIVLLFFPATVALLTHIQFVMYNISKILLADSIIEPCILHLVTLHLIPPPLEVQHFALISFKFHSILTEGV